MKTIYKYPLPIGDSVSITMCEPAEILSIQVQHGVPFVWALIDDEGPPVKRKFRIAGTGHPLVSLGEFKFRFIDTIQLEGGSLVFHVFQILEVEADERETDEACKHIGTVPYFDHVRCKSCPAVKTDSQWGIAKNRWFDSLDIAKFYQKNGRMPEAAP